jgi:NADH-quinone oxidoreductase subunit E
MFFLKPVGKHIVSVCRNISCDLRGSKELLDRVCQVTGARAGTNSEDGRFYVEHVECQGNCANAPMMVVDGIYHADLSPEKAEEILGGLDR